MTVRLVFLSVLAGKWSAKCKGKIFYESCTCSAAADDAMSRGCLQSFQSQLVKAVRVELEKRDIKGTRTDKPPHTRGGNKNNSNYTNRAK